MNEDIIRKLPFSLIAEQSLLGSILVDPEAFNEIADIVGADDFYITEHKLIYNAMHELFLVNNEIDVVTLIDMLVKIGAYDKSGGEDYIKTISEVVPNALNVKDYARIVKDKSILRQLIDVCGDINEKAYSEQDSITHIVDYAENKIYSIAQGKNTQSFKHVKDVLQNVYAHLHELNTNKDAAIGTQTGFSGLDKLLVGMGSSDLIIVGARPGMGKTSFVLNIGTNVAAKSQKKVCIFSLEMSAEQLVTRIVSSEAMIDSNSLRTGELSAEEWDNLAVAASKLSECDILIDDTPGITVTEMKAKLRREKNLGLVIIDYLQLMQGSGRSENRVNEVSEISRGLKILAKELGVPVICCSQLSRGSDKREDKRPMMSDLRESGSIEQDADIVMFLYRDEYYDKSAENQNEGNIAEVIVEKNRHGARGTVKMGWIGKFTKFRTIANQEQ